MYVRTFAPAENNATDSFKENALKIAFIATYLLNAHARRRLNCVYFLGRMVSLIFRNYQWGGFSQF